jgi:tetratricopeptide (TPR) repeat protein
MAMKKILFAIACCFTSVVGFAQTQTVQQLQETARSFMRQGDYANAILVLNRGLQQEPDNIPMAKDLAMSYYYQKDNNKALEVIKPLLDNDKSDDQVFQIAGNIYKQLALVKDCEKMYKKGIKKFPDSGPLYNELGELQWAQQDYEAIKNWEKGIEVDPSYSKNYYNAARYYFLTNDKVWSILYGETFINMEPMSSKAPEVKQLLLDSYKKLFSVTDLLLDNKDKNTFTKAFLTEMNKQSGLLGFGVNTESLTMVRTRFILDWFNTQQGKMPFKLFEYQQQLLKDGMFDAYNQWLFGSIQNLSGYQNWINTHTQENTAFTDFQKGRIFKVPAGQYYH